jgi:hypothetical protein
MVIVIMVIVILSRCRGLYSHTLDVPQKVTRSITGSIGGRTRAHGDQLSIRDTGIVRGLPGTSITSGVWGRFIFIHLHFCRWSRGWWRSE